MGKGEPTSEAGGVADGPDAVEHEPDVEGRPTDVKINPAPGARRIVDHLAAEFRAAGYATTSVSPDDRVPAFAADLFERHVEHAAAEVVGRLRADGSRIRPRFWVYAWTFAHARTADELLQTWLRRFDGLRNYRLGDHLAGVKSPPLFAAAGDRTLVVVVGRCENGPAAQDDMNKVLDDLVGGELGVRISSGVKIGCGGPVTPVE